MARSARPVEVDPTAPWRRRIRLRNAPGVTEGSIEDRFHHFEVRVDHADGLVVGVEGGAVRAPWSVCPGAAAVLGELRGLPLGVLPSVGDPSAHCTHLLDVAILAIRFADRPVRERSIELCAGDGAGSTVVARAERDDGRALEWTVDRGRIVAPEPFAGRRLGKGFSAFVAGRLDGEVAELALALRRATWMRISQGIDLDRFDVLAESGVPRGACYAAQPERIELARRNRGASVVELGGAPADRRQGS